MSAGDLRASADRPAEVLKVGQSYGLYRKDNQALALVNAAAVRACLPAFAAIDTSDLDPNFSAADHANIPQVEAAALIGQLASAGFLDGSLELLPSYRVPLPANSMLALSGTFGLPGTSLVHLVCNDGQLDALLKAALEPLRVASAPASASQVHVLRSVDGYVVSRDGIVIAAGLDLATARRVVLQSIAMAMLPSGQTAAFVHASTVVCSGKAILLAGGTGSGKTTLMMALVGAGAHYLADDLTPLDSQGESVAPYPLAASIKSGSWQALVREFPDLMTSPVHRVGERRVRYLDPACGGRAWSGPAPIGTLLFPRYVPAEPLRVGRLEPEDALDRLLRSGSEVVGRNASLRPLARLVDRTPCWEMAFPDLASACDAVAGIARQR